MIDFERKEHYGLSDLLRIVALLRSEGGCPWDRVQTHASLRRSLLEEAYEAASADSLHKSLPVCTGGALLHLAKKELYGKAKEKMRLFGSTSPSYLIMLYLTYPYM